MGDIKMRNPLITGSTFSQNDLWDDIEVYRKSKDVFSVHRIPAGLGWLGQPPEGAYVNTKETIEYMSLKELNDFLITLADYDFDESIKAQKLEEEINEL